MGPVECGWAVRAQVSRVHSFNANIVRDPTTTLQTEFQLTAVADSCYRRSASKVHRHACQIVGMVKPRYPPLLLATHHFLGSLGLERATLTIPHGTRAFAFILSNVFCLPRIVWR